MDSTNSASGGNGPVVGVIVVIIVLLVGAFYFMGELRAPLMGETATTTEDVATTTDDIDTLEADLNAETFEDLDAELNAY